jgi:hypothetical protein
VIEFVHLSRLRLQILLSPEHLPQFLAIALTFGQDAKAPHHIPFQLALRWRTAECNQRWEEGWQQSSAHRRAQRLQARVDRAEHRIRVVYSCLFLWRLRTRPSHSHLRAPGLLPNTPARLVPPPLIPGGGASSQKNDAHPALSGRLVQSACLPYTRISKSVHGIALLSREYHKNSCKTTRKPCTISTNSLDERYRWG